MEKSNVIMEKNNVVVEKSEEPKIRKPFNSMNDEELAQELANYGAKMEKMKGMYCVVKDPGYSQEDVDTTLVQSLLQAIINGRKAGFSEVYGVECSNLYRFYKAGSEKFGLMYCNGTVAVDNVCDALAQTLNGTTPYRAGGKWGIVDENIYRVVEPQFDDIELDVDEVVMVKLGDKWGFIDKRGRFTDNVEEAYFNTIVN